MVKDAVPVGAPGAKPDDKVTLQAKVAPAAAGKPQLTALTPVPAATELATTPAGSTSEIRTLVPDVVPPVFPRPSVYWMVALPTAVDGADLDNTKLDESGLIETPPKEGGKAVPAVPSRLKLAWSTPLMKYWAEPEVPVFDRRSTK